MMKKNAMSVYSVYMQLSAYRDNRKKIINVTRTRYCISSDNKLLQ